MSCKEISWVHIGIGNQGKRSENYQKFRTIQTHVLEVIFDMNLCKWHASQSDRRAVLLMSTCLFLLPVSFCLCSNIVNSCKLFSTCCWILSVSCAPLCLPLWILFRSHRYRKTSYVDHHATSSSQQFGSLYDTQEISMETLQGVARGEVNTNPERDWDM